MKAVTRLVVAIVVAISVLAVASAAYARNSSDPPWVPIDKTGGGPGGCEPCHYDLDQPVSKYGPHGNYFSTTNRCRFCHRVHEAEELAIFQEASPTAAIRNTISALCYVCHDNTGKMGVYSQLQALGFTPGASHSVDATVAIPGGDAGPMKLTCTSCHTPHNNTRMAAGWASFNPRNSTFQLWPGQAEWNTNRLLRDDVGGQPRGTYTRYGSKWCAGCHNRRIPTPVMANHPVDTQTAYQAYVTTWTDAPQLGVFIFDPVIANSFETSGRVSPRPAAPRCQQCHETGMDVEGQLWDADFGGPGWAYGNMGQSGGRARQIDPDGPGPSNPTTIGDSFPHQTTTRYMLVESGDDLCLNCHSTTNLP